MAYMYADTGNKVGFRPYHQTDAFGAAHLSGYGSGLGQNHPFKPEAWHLHGMDGTFLGTYHLNRPFDPWELYAGVHETAGVRSGMHGLGNLGAEPDITAQAADELQAAGHITQAEHDAILEGSVTFQDVLGYDPTDQSSWVDAAGILRQWNSDLQAIEAQIIAANNQRMQSGLQPAAEFADLASQVNQQRQRFNSISQQFINLYRVVTGTVPPGLSGLGVVPLAAYVAGAAVLIAAVYYGHQAFETWRQSVHVSEIVANTAKEQADTDAHLADTLARQQAAGDTAGANATIALMKQRAPSQTLPGPAEKWLMDNAKWIGLGAAGLIVLGPLSQGLFGRRR